MTTATVTRIATDLTTGITTDLIPVIGYIRVSTWREEMISPDLQREAITEAAARAGRYVILWVEDPDATGRNFKRRIMEAIEAVEAGLAMEIWVWKFSRFGRSRHGVAINLARVEHVGGQLISATEDIDATTATGRFARGMLFEVAAFESDRAGEQWKETHELRRGLGRPATGGKRFGYRWHPRRVPDGAGGWTLQDEHYEVLTTQAPYVYDGYLHYTEGAIGFGLLARRWHDEGLLNTRGSRWQDQTVKNYLDSGFAAGLLHCHRRDVRCGNPGQCQRWDEHWTYLPAEHEAIITGDEWDAYRARRTTRKGTPRRALTPVYPLAGLLRCGLCHGAAMIHQSKGIPGYAYRCDARARNKVDHDSVWRRRSLIEGDVHQWLADLQTEIDATAAGVTAEVPEERKPQPANAGKRRRLIKRVSKFAAAVDRATEGYTLGEIPRDTYLRTRDKFVLARDQAQKELDQLDKGAAPVVGPADYRETVEGLLVEWDTIAVTSKRVLLATVIRCVEFTSDTTEVVPVWAPECVSL
jgi:DNA invertase Pin-like site-specific DNA recombinase